MAIFLHRMSGTNGATRLWVSTFNSSSGQDINTVHSAFETWIQNTITATMLPLWAPSQTVDTAETDRIDGVTGRFLEQVITHPNLTGSGTQSDQSDPRAAVVVGKRTNLPTRAGRGRMYIPAVTQNNIDNDGLLVPSVQTSIAGTFAGAWSTMGGTSQPVIFHRSNMPPTPITRVTVGVVLGGQNRRTNKVPQEYAGAAV